MQKRWRRAWSLAQFPWLTLHSVLYDSGKELCFLFVCSLGFYLGCLDSIDPSFLLKGNTLKRLSKWFTVVLGKEEGFVLFDQEINGFLLLLFESVCVCVRTQREVESLTPPSRGWLFGTIGDHWWLFLQRQCDVEQMCQSTGKHRHEVHMHARKHTHTRTHKIHWN